MSTKDALAQTLRTFLGSASTRPGVWPRRLLKAMRAVALEDAEDGPISVELVQVIDRASQLAARENPDHPLDQAKHRQLLWELFQQLTKARVGRAWAGRRGHPSRFTFAPRLSAQEIAQVFDELRVRPPAPVTPESPRSPDLSPAKATSVEPRTSTPLSRESVIALLREHQEEVRQLGLSSLSLFGSVARNEARADSDVDLLATFSEPITSDVFFTAKFFLEDLLGRRVDLLNDAGLRDRVRENIAPELVRVA